MIRFSRSMAVPTDLPPTVRLQRTRRVCSRPAGSLSWRSAPARERSVTELFTANGLATTHTRHDLSGIVRALAASVR